MDQRCSRCSESIVEAPIWSRQNSNTTVFDQNPCLSTQRRACCYQDRTLVRVPHCLRHLGFAVVWTSLTHRSSHTKGSHRCHPPSKPPTMSNSAFQIWLSLMTVHAGRNPLNHLLIRPGFPVKACIPYSLIST